MNEITVIQGVRGYCDENGTAWLSAEDVARGLGFVDNQEKDSATGGRKTYEVIRWARVNGYLREFGYPTEVRTGDFLPENMVYRLAMKANNEVAQNFQAQLADVILPTIRKTGSYSVAQKPATPLADAVYDIRMMAEQILLLQPGVNVSIAKYQAIDFANVKYEFNFNALKQLLPPAEHETGYLNPTQIGEKLGGLPARIVNKLLADAGLQYKDGKNWRLTELGKQYGEEMPYTRNNHSGYQIRWNESVVDYLAERAA